MLTWTDLQDYVGASASDKQYLETCLATATALVDTHIGDAEVPDDVRESVLLEVGSKLYARRGAPAGFTGGDTVTTPGVLVAKDPMVTVYPILARYVVAGL